MTKRIFDGTVQFKNGTASAWTSNNITLAKGEIGIEIDTNKMKIGDGVNPWNSLQYFPASANVFTGATSSAAGTAGLVPSPASGYNNKYLKGDGTWGTCDADTLKGVAPSVSGNHSFPFIPVIQGDGVMEVGKFIDFHDASGDSADYSTRLTSSGIGLSIGTNAPISRLEFATNSTNGFMQFDSAGHFNFPDNEIYCQGGRLVRDTEFPLYSQPAGWIRFVGGLIIAWGRITKSGSDSTYFTYPRGFGDVYGAWACMVSGGSSNYAYNGAFCQNVSTTGCNVYANASESSGFRILIIGRE